MSSSSLRVLKAQNPAKNTAQSPSQSPFKREPHPLQPTTPIPRRVLDDPKLQDDILNDYLDGAAVPFSIAQKNGITVDELIAFIRSDAVCTRLKDLEAFARDRARRIAVLNLPAALQRLVDTMSDRHGNPIESRRAASALIREHNRNEKASGGAGSQPALSQPCPHCGAGTPNRATNVAAKSVSDAPDHRCAPKRTSLRPNAPTSNPKPPLPWPRIHTNGTAHPHSRTAPSPPRR